MRSLLLAFALLAGCTVGTQTSGPGGGTPGGVDAATQSGSNTGNNGGSNGNNGSGSNTGSGSGSGTACTGAVYDPCTDAGQCMSGKCQAFQAAGIEVCTQTCTPGDNTTCPTQNGQPAQCNNMGICKPPAANSCTR